MNEADSLPIQIVILPPSEDSVGRSFASIKQAAAAAGREIGQTMARQNQSDANSHVNVWKQAISQEAQLRRAQVSMYSDMARRAQQEEVAQRRMTLAHIQAMNEDARRTEMASAGAFFKRFAAMTWEWTRVVYGMTALIGAALSPAIVGIKLQKDMEDARVGITGILVSMTNLNGKAMEFNDAWRISGTLVKEVQADSIKYGIQMGQIVNTFRAILAPGIGAGMSIAQIQKLASVGSVAVSAIGLPAQQMVQEIRDLVTGGIQASQNTLATALGITGKDILEIQRNGGDLFKFLMDRLEGFGRVAEETRKATLSGSWEIFLGKLGLALAANTGPFDMLKEAIHGATKALEDPATKDVITVYTKILMGVATTLGMVVKGWGLLLSELDRKLPEMKVPGSWGMLIKLAELLPKATFIDTTNERPWKSQGVQNHFAPNVQGQSDVITQNDLSVLAELNKDITNLHAKYETEAERHGKAVLDIETKYNRGISEQRLLAFKAYSADDMKMFQEHQNTAAQLKKQMQSDLAMENAKNATKDKYSADMIAEAKLREEAFQSSMKYVDSIDSETKSITQKTAATVLETESIGKTKEQIDLLQAARYDHQTEMMKETLRTYESANACTIEAEALKDAIAAREAYKKAQTDQSGVHASQAVTDAAVKASKESAAEFKRASDSINNSLTDALMRAFEAGKGFAAAFRDTVVNMFKTMILRPIISAIMTPLSAPMATAGAGLSAYLFGTSAVAATGAAAAMGPTIETAATGGLLTSGGALTALGTVAVGAAAAYAIAKYGFGWGNGRQNVGPQRLVGDFTSSGFTGKMAQDWKQDGGWFGSDSSGTTYSAITTAQGKAFKATVDGLQKTFNALGDTIGYSDIKTQAWSVHVNKSGDVTGVLADGIANQLIPSLGHLRATGENLAQTAQRVNDSFIVTSQFISGLGLSEKDAFGAIGIASADMRIKLIDAAGGLQSFTALAAQFSQSILTPAQQLQVSLDAVGKTFAQLGVTGVYTKEQFYALVQEQTKLGNTDNVTKLMAVSDAFAKVVDSATAATTALNTQASAAITQAQNQYSATLTAVDALRTFGVSVRDLMASLSATTSGGSSLSALRDQFLFTNALSASGNVSAQGKLSGSATAFLNEAKTQSASSADYARAVAMVQNALGATATKIEATVSYADQQLSLAKNSNSFLQGIQTNTGATANNISALASALNVLNKYNATAAAAVTVANTAAAASAATSPTAAAITTATTTQADLIAAQQLADRKAAKDAAYQAMVDAGNVIALSIFGSSVTAQKAESLGWGPSFPAVAAYETAIANYNALPAFASGGDFGGGLRIVGERGIELEATGPSRIMSNNDLMSRLRDPGANSAALLEEIKGLRAEVAALRKSSDKAAQSSEKTTNLLRNVTRDGSSVFTTPA